MNATYQLDPHYRPRRLGCWLFRWTAPLAAVVCLPAATLAGAAPTVVREGGCVLVSGEQYRLSFTPELAGFELELRTGEGEWRKLVEKSADLTLAYFDGSEHPVRGQRATWALAETDEYVAVGQQVVLRPQAGLVLDLHFVCTDDGVLIGAKLTSREPVAGGNLWCPPRLRFEPGDWDGYLFWAPDGAAHAGSIGDLDPCPAYAGVSAWEQQGDTVSRLSTDRPAVLMQSSKLRTGIGVVFVDYATRWGDACSYIQRHTPEALYLYSGYAPVASASDTLWAWLAPFPDADASRAAKQVEKLVADGRRLIQAFKPVSQPVPDEWIRPVPDFPEELRRREPVRDINDAVVFTINEYTSSDYAIDLARKIGSDCLIRGWFKWHTAPPVSKWTDMPGKAHQLGALFGGGITCSALYDDENGLTREQVLDMATRGPAGQLIDAWDEPGTRHGTLSSPAYVDYLFRWCREQIDAGADYLFMDEITAALSGMEGYDDHSLRDFREYLLKHAPQTQGWQPSDARWRGDLGIDLTDKALCPDGTMGSFDYRAFMRAKGVLDKPTSPDNTLAALWKQFRSWRDDRAWKSLTDRIRAYATEKGRTVLISANGIAKYVDLQVLGVWGNWVTDDGHIDLTESQLPVWRSLVKRGHAVAAKRVPVVLFHDWGFGDPPFPFLGVPPSERETWMRVRGAEIYAAGGFFAFPVLGPFGCDASRDGTLPVIADQTAFYQRHRELYLRGQHVGSEALASDTPNLTLAAWRSDEPSAVVLHVINRNTEGGELQPQTDATIRVSVDRAPDRTEVVSPDWEGARNATCRLTDGSLEVTLPQLDAYAVCLLHYAEIPDLSRLKDPTRIVPTALWSRPPRSEFRVRADGTVEGESDLNGYLQGMLHTHLRNPPTFVVNAKAEGKLLVKVRAVANTGARIEFRVDGKTTQTVDLPDLDGKNDGAAPEYDKVLTFVFPAGEHKLTLDNVGGRLADVELVRVAGGVRGLSGRQPSMGLPTRGQVRSSMVLRTSRVAETRGSGLPSPEH